MNVGDYILLTVTNDTLFFSLRTRRGNDFGRDQNETAEREASVNLVSISAFQEKKEK